MRAASQPQAGGGIGVGPRVCPAPAATHGSRDAGCLPRPCVSLPRGGAAPPQAAAVAAAAALQLRQRHTVRLRTRNAAVGDDGMQGHSVLHHEPEVAVPAVGLKQPLERRGLPSSLSEAGSALSAPAVAAHQPLPRQASAAVAAAAAAAAVARAAAQQSLSLQDGAAAAAAATAAVAAGGPKPQPLPPQTSAAVAAAAAAATRAQEDLAEDADAEGFRPGAIWGLGIATAAYLHLSVTLYSLPSLVPFISQDLHLDDAQGALLTTGYTILYGLVLVPMGMVADFTNRPRLLAGGIALWSILNMAASQSQSFGQLIATRIGFAAAQATCNPVAYSLIPELFPKNRTAAMAVYNTAIYLGRAAAFGVVLLAGQQAVTQGGVDAGAAVEAAVPAWRTLLWWLGPPGLLLSGLALATMEDPRKQSSSGRFLPLVTVSMDSMDSMGSMDSGDSKHSSSSTHSSSSSSTHSSSGGGGGGADASSALLGPQQHSGRGHLVSAPESSAPTLQESLGHLRGLLSNPAFLALTGATAFGDVASWALIGWQGIFYARVMELEPSVYAPLVAVGISVGGICGGIGSGLFGDRMASMGARGWLTAGTSIAAAPLMAASFLLPDYRQSFVALLVGYALSECWRAPAAVMVREVSPPGLGSTASAVNLCVRMMAGAAGPVGIAMLSHEVGLQYAMLLIPACHLAAGLGLAATEVVIENEKEKTKAVKHAVLAGHTAGHH